MRFTCRRSPKKWASGRGRLKLHRLHLHLQRNQPRQRLVSIYTTYMRNFAYRLQTSHRLRGRALLIDQPLARHGSSRPRAQALHRHSAASSSPGTLLGMDHTEPRSGPPSQRLCRLKGQTRRAGPPATSSHLNDQPMISISPSRYLRGESTLARTFWIVRRACRPVTSPKQSLGRTWMHRKIHSRLL